jgi:hypothetical protein
LKILLKETVATAFFIGGPGDVVECPDDLVDGLVTAGVAEIVDDSVPASGTAEDLVVQADGAERIVVKADGCPILPRVDPAVEAEIQAEATAKRSKRKGGRWAR